MLTKIRLELARDHDHPEGSRAIGYEFAAPLDASGKIDAAEWHKRRENCRVVRFRPGEADDIGHLVRKGGGSWAFHYDIKSHEEDDEFGLPLRRPCLQARRICLDPGGGGSADLPRGAGAAGLA